MGEKFVRQIIDEERERCRGLAELLHREPGFLVYCIDNAIMPLETNDWRDRYTQTLPDDEPAPAKPADDFEDLM